MQVLKRIVRSDHDGGNLKRTEMRHGNDRGEVKKSGGYRFEPECRSGGMVDDVIETR